MWTEPNERALPDRSPASAVAKSETFPSPADLLETIFVGLKAGETPLIAKVISKDARSGKQIRIDYHLSLIHI